MRRHERQSLLWHLLNVHICEWRNTSLWKGILAESQKKQWWSVPAPRDRETITKMRTELDTKSGLKECQMQQDVHVVYQIDTASLAGRAE
jgi:hypothetical protein